MRPISQNSAHRRPIFRNFVFSITFSNAEHGNPLPVGLNGLLRPPELSAIGPYALQDDRNLTRYCDTGLLRAYAFRQARSPRLERRPPLHLSKENVGGFVKAGSGKSVSAL